LSFFALCHILNCELDIKNEKRQSLTLFNIISFLKNL